MRVDRFVLALLAVAPLVLGACGGGALGNAADHGDYAALKRELASRQSRGDLTNDEAADLAHRVAAFELASAPPKDAVARVREARACAKELDEPLAERMRTNDAAGAEAALARIDSGEIDAEDLRGHAADPDDAWRAVGVRGLVAPSDRDTRLRAFRDPAPGVRRAAVAASAEVRDARDVAELAEVARLDPEGLVRTDAVRALTRLVDADDDKARAAADKVASVLRDLWTTGDDALKEDLAATWVVPALWERGGREALAVLVATEHGPGALTAAWVVTRAPESPGDATLRASAGALLARALDRGSRRERLYALTVASLEDPAVLASVRDLARGDDAEARVLANARLLERAQDRAAATAALEKVAGQPLYGRLATRALAALAGAGDRRVQAWIERDLDASDAASALTAVSSLSALGRSARGAPLLAAADASVRMRAACTLLTASREHL